ncbi:hypothetical protein LZ554_001159 [Drepanopeziza brunnea f. sp. 'monogermtubi']|nr:hypothetical protein LZ554_001159 [Drepanopeziza brunnea f. sp. 'monogermtubi']
MAPIVFCGCLKQSIRYSCRHIRVDPDPGAFNGCAIAEARYPQRICASSGYILKDPRIVNDRNCGNCAAEDRKSKERKEGERRERREKKEREWVKRADEKKAKKAKKEKEAEKKKEVPSELDKRMQKPANFR